MLCELYIVSDSWQGIEYDEKVRCGLKRPRFIIHTIPSLSGRTKENHENYTRTAVLRAGILNGMGR